MSIFTSITKRYKAITAKQFMFAGVFAIALASSIGLGLAAHGLSSAATIRDCDTNSIDFRPHNGGCGAANPSEFIKDVRQNDPSDLQTIYANLVGLNAANYSKFASSAQEGTINRDGTVVVDGQTVMTGVQTYGRKSFGNPNRKPITIGGKTYYHAAPGTSFASGVKSLPAMVLFDANGAAQIAVMNPCGNPVTGHKVPSTFTCKTLNKTAVSGKANTYDFTTNAPFSGLAKIVQLEYFVDGKSVKITKNPSTVVRLSFTKTSTVTVKVTFSLPGKQIRVVTSTKCSRVVTVKTPPVVHVCSALIATSSDNQTFRFTALTSQTSGVGVQSADFTLDGTSTVTGVTSKDSKGNIFREYTFTDDVQHTVNVKQVTFIVNGKPVVVVTPEGKCEASVTPKQTPPCTKNPNLPECQPPAPTCVPAPNQDENCQELVHTGPTGTVGLFTGVSALGAAGHRLVSRRRARRRE